MTSPEHKRRRLSMFHYTLIETIWTHENLLWLYLVGYILDMPSSSKTESVSALTLRICQNREEDKVLELDTEGT